MRTRSSYPQWIKVQIDSLQPNQHFVIPGHIASTIDEMNFRTSISALNRRSGTNLRVHRDTTTVPPSLWVWYDPTPKQTPPNSQSATLDSINHQLSTLTGAELESFKQSLTQIPFPTKPIYKNRDSITLPLSTILSHLNLTKQQWQNIPPDERLKLRIKTELSIKFSLPSHPTSVGNQTTKPTM